MFELAIIIWLVAKTNDNTESYMKKNLRTGNFLSI